MAPLSHASYFEAGTHPYPVGIDHPYGDGPASRELPGLPFEASAVHDGERVIASRIGVGAPRLRRTPVLIPFPTAPAQPAVYGRTFNALRQRSAAARARELPK
jgi:hypothetical protein